LPFARMLKSADINIVLLPPRSPNLNAYIERDMRSMKSECLEEMVFLGENSPRRALGKFESHYHHEQNHQGLENNIIDFRDAAG
jgi:putative transposase